VTGQRTLIVMRHAKAEPYATTDHARKITERGRVDAVAAGRELAALGVTPDLVVLSTATRVLMTWAEVEGALDGEYEVQSDAAAYAGGVDVVLETLQAVPEDVETLMFVGHNPTVAHLCRLLDDGDGDPDAVSGLLRGFPAGAFVVFDVTLPWGELDVETCRVRAFHAPTAEPGRP
jgi:phosphohistidine phosphatase